MPSNTPWAFYDPDGSCLRTSQPSLLDGPDSMWSSLDLPRSGSMLSGRVYERPMLGRRTVGSGGSSLLPTPVVNDMGDGKELDWWDAWTVEMQMKHGNGNGHGKSLAIEAQRLLPTPTVSDTYTDNLASSQQSDGSMHSVTLPQAVRTRLPGASSPPPSNSGNGSSDDGRRLPLTTEDDCPHRSSSG